MTTKERILEEAMKLFSVYGYEAVTVRKIGEAVGIQNSALYKHFKNKQAIFDALVERSKEIFQEKYMTYNYEHMDLDDFRTMCLEMFRFQTEEPWIVMFRKMLLMGQFSNPDLAAVYQKLFIHQPIECQSQIFQALMDQNLMKQRDPYVLSMELYAPFFLFHTVEERPEALISRFQTHVEYFLSDNIITRSKESESCER